MITFSDKDILLKRIKNINDKKLLLKIKHLIKKMNPELRTSINNKCETFYFHNLTDDTYIKINKILDKIVNIDNINNINRIILSNDNNDDINKKISTRERNIMKRLEYENNIRKQNDKTKEILNELNK